MVVQNNEMLQISSPQHYSSTPHLFVYQAHSDEEDCNVNFPKNESFSSNPHGKYNTISRILMQRQDSNPYEDPQAVTEDDVSRIETFFSGYLTQIWVCRTMANLYRKIDVGTPKESWQLRFTGVPLLLLDAGDTKSRNKRQLQLIMAEKGTGFALWRDIVDNLTSYRVEESHFHTLYLSSDHRQRIGLSFNNGDLAMNFYHVLEKLTSDPANISLSGPDKKKDKIKVKLPKYKAPNKADISLPCNFSHVTSVDTTDKSRFFSLQLFSKRLSSADTKDRPPFIENYSGEKTS